jgi:hypothetical protein
MDPIASARADFCFADGAALQHELGGNRQNMQLFLLHLGCQMSQFLFHQG